MALINRKAAKKKPVHNYKLLGLNIYPRQFDYITLFTLANGISKTSILKPTLDDWICQQQSKYTEEELLNMLAERIDAEWKVKRATRKKIKFDHFKVAIMKELKEKGLKKEHIDYVIKEIE